MKAYLRCFARYLLLTTFCIPSQSQTSCPVIAIPQPPPGANIFNAQQEAALGDAMDAGVRQNIHMVQDQVLAKPLIAVADRLEAQMPPEHPKFRVVLFDSSSADAFSIPGHIYISRKLVAVTRSEDEMAGILAHEMGHLLAHHSAVGATENFRRVLQVTQVGDNADVVAKWNQYLNNYRRVKYTGTDVARSEKTENKHQEQADSIALSLVAEAGYSTQAFADVFDRIAETQGKTGNAWTDFFGDTPPDSKRLRQMVKARPSLSPECVKAHGATIPDYASWRTKVIESVDTQSVRVAGLISSRQLTERLRPEVGHIRISPDGKYVLAQDDSNIFVLTRSPLKSLFRIGAPDANPAHFTPDSKGIAFHIATMGSSPRVEHWDIASQRRMEVHEIYVRRGCLVSALSPDAHTLACLTAAETDAGLSYDLDLFDTITATSYYHKKEWVAVNGFRLDYSTLWQIAMAMATGPQQFFEKLLRISISPDGRYLVAHSPENILAMDLNTRSQINLPGNIKDILSYGRFSFLSDGRFMGVGGNNGDKLKVVEFPSGRAIYSDILVGAAKVGRVARGEFAILSPIRDSPIGVIDLKQNKIFFQSKRTALDIWETQAIGERENGDLIAVDLATAKILESAPLPEAEVGGVRAGAVSPDLSWLAVSQNSRGAVWNVGNGQRLYHMRGFRGGYFDSGGNFVADFPKYLKTERSIVDMSLAQQNIRPLYVVEEKDHSLQAGKYLLNIVPASEKGDTNHNVTFEVRSLLDRNLIWSKHFAQERPGYFLDQDTNSLVLYWRAGSKEIQSLVKQDSEAAARLAPFKNRDGIDYVQVLDFDSGNLRFAVAIDTGKDSIRVADITAGSDRLVVADGNNRLLVYDSTGGLLGTLNGSRPQISPLSNRLSARTQSGELTLYDVQSLQSLAVYTFDSRVAFSAFSADSKRLLVLCASQMLYLIDTGAH